ncbi:MAG TPA: serine/threonine-protein kinase, partial [Kofleriaceae bacterium]|nr:serine/threonine-protein kinase [Kofleriaceae bacterium]
MELASDNATAPVGALAVTHVAVAPAPAIALPAGTRIGRHEIIRVLGRGGMGQVYLARDVVLGRRVAIKFMLDDRPELVERFLVEARATARCQHENIVVIHELGDYHGHGFMVLEYLEGETLAAAVAAGPHPIARAIELLLPVARALVHAHAHGLVHRDLKPENVFVTAEGAVKVLDFGIAAAFDGEPGVVAPGRASTIVGTPLYMAPEQHLGLPVDQAADQWALGLMLHELVVGRHPLGDPPTRAALTGVGDLDLPMPPCPTDGVPAEVAAVIDRCLRKRPEERFPSTRALHEALEAVQPARGARGDDLRPFPGLAAFTAADADVYFGRSADVRRALGRLREQPVLAVVGPSGVGKSSFVRAGLGRALADEEPWEVLATRPGRTPLASLVELVAMAGGAGGAGGAAGAAAGEEAMDRLRAEPGHLAALLRARAQRTRRKVLLFIDQLEELFTQDAPIEDRAAYVACVDAIADDLAAPVRLVVAMRADFLDRLAEHGELMARLARALLFLSPLDRTGLREALVQPVARAGYRFESDAVVDDVLDAIEHAPAALPLLQFVAERMWDSRDRAARTLTADAYRGMGGLVGAIATHADRVIAELPPGRQRAARALFLRLVTPERTRAIVELRELTEAGDPDLVAGLLDVLVGARLLVVSGDGDRRTIEIVHEALITGWPALAAWIGEEHEVVAFVA